ncbi:hypothetical protein A2U94_02635 [Bacillus sp. VT 712]|uniref:Uncharacterized protein n=2 Tax=Priestia TaxID=2800373 RepID=A0A0V8JQJ1_9BACI|nr:MULTISPECIES: hypothetical protein [Priestia]KSU89358.1 hypothetical protein AS180_02025 [Priestia veravalensis]KZB92883.1 hypothetical protein A2U94_02635 [Bacillus sp. VT 712]MCG7312598.1 hypothetical protein [Priestia flexa]SCB84044.1 hypothetical protein GA0061087_100210 [Priestia flexa]
MEWSVGHSTPAGKRGQTEFRSAAQVPPRGKRVAVEQWNELVQVTKEVRKGSVDIFENLFCYVPSSFSLFEKLSNVEKNR